MLVVVESDRGMDLEPQQTSTGPAFYNHLAHICFFSLFTLNRHGSLLCPQKHREITANDCVDSLFKEDYYPSFTE